ncbi:MAG: YceD family protein [Pseudomonadota bacterium]
MAAGLPDRFDPRVLARAERTLRGTVSVDGMDRLREMAQACAPDATVELRFSESANGVVCIEGSVHLDATATCQRCLEPMPLTIDTSVAIAYVIDGVTNDCGDGYDVIETQDRPLDEPWMMGGFVEDELLLAWPDFPVHISGDCSLDEAYNERPVEDNPFAVLEQLKSRLSE